MLVHRDATIKEIMARVIEELGFDKTSSDLSIWAIDSNGQANLDDSDGVLKLNLAHTSPVMNMPFGKVFGIMQETAMKVSQLNCKGYSNDGKPLHNESKLVQKQVMTLTGGKYVRENPVLFKKKKCLRDMVYVLWSRCKRFSLDLTAASTLRGSIPRRVSFHCVVLLRDALTCKSI